MDPNSEAILKIQLEDAIDAEAEAAVSPTPVYMLKQYTEHCHRALAHAQLTDSHLQKSAVNHIPQRNAIQLKLMQNKFEHT